MLDIATQTCSPVLRLKEGEYTALPELTPQVADRLLPLFVIPPPKESDPEFGRVLTKAELAYVPGMRVGRHWPLRTCLLDVRFLYKTLGCDTAVSWLPSLFQAAYSANGRPILVSDLKSIDGSEFDGIFKTIKKFNDAIALRITSTDLVKDNLKNRIHAALRRLVLKPSQCFLILDFEAPEFSNLSVVAEIMVANFQQIMEIGIWGQVIWQATSYPETNPAQPTELVILPRNEWLAWCTAARLDEQFLKHVMYGDYGADSCKFNFGPGGIRPKRHYRYSTDDKWLIPRGPDEGGVAAAMRWVAQEILDSGFFAGCNFSSGDRFITDTALGRTCGNATTWRKVNTIHHLTRVVADLGAFRGYKIIERREPTPADEPTFVGI